MIQLVIVYASTPSNIPQPKRVHELAVCCSIDVPRILPVFTNADFSGYLQLVLRAQFLQNAQRLTGGSNFCGKGAEYSSIFVREQTIWVTLCLGNLNIYPIFIDTSICIENRLSSTMCR
jgi:hypothetical protein